MLAPSQAVAPVVDRPPPPPLLASNSLFLDFDGTLVELAERPDGVIVGADLLALLDRLMTALDGRLAIVSGRSIRQLDALLGPAAAAITLAGSHGAERRTPTEGYVAADGAASLHDVAQRFEAFAEAHPGVIVEVKSHGVALHYRLAPEREPAALGLAARIAADAGLILQHGKMMAEARVAGDKGAALAALMQLPGFAGSTPFFCGDDVTDEDGFIAARALGGGGILIGDPRDTAASWRLPGVAALHRWLTTSLSELL
ncbi:trehalose-phosphatase [Sphingomonas nostoxanthinifaciens]|uniref:trehalose-phosphatase n=1 Tax=Sphingomonas nostoxanthinifaciens TaxID=2872652 RepID=UPI001CC20E88|nr:trehalose-phosphatase [Sphingomonas nostoxanthinifaciens]UAK25219.1 trehalose-phosphatase [Sphingomonas nostoxanthinifaciens]